MFNIILIYYRYFIDYVWLYLINTKNTKRINIKGFNIENIYIKKAYIRDICVGNTNIIKYLKIYLQSSYILQIR